MKGVDGHFIKYELIGYIIYGRHNDFNLMIYITIGRYEKNNIHNIKFKMEKDIKILFQFLLFKQEISNYKAFNLSTQLSYTTYKYYPISI